MTVDDDDNDCEDKMRYKKPENVHLEVSRIYLKCKYERQCIGLPDESCLEEKNCDFVASWGKEGDYVAFGLVANKVTYAAIGISKDEHMVSLMSGLCECGTGDECQITK